MNLRWDNDLKSSGNLVRFEGLLQNVRLGFEDINLKIWVLFWVIFYALVDEFWTEITQTI